MAYPKDLKEKNEIEEVVEKTEVEETTQTDEENITDTPDKDTLTKEDVDADKPEDKQEFDTSGYPEGLDESMYNLEEGTFKEDGVIAKLKELKNKIELSEKRVKDFRKIVSKGKAPKDISAYDKYKPEERFEKFFDFENKDNAQVKNILGNFNEIAFELGFNEAQHEKVVNFMNEVLESNNVLNTKSVDDIKAEHKVWLEGERAKLASNPVEANRIIDKTVEFVKNYNILNEDEKTYAIKSMNKEGALAVGVWAKIESLFSNDSVPTSHSDNSGLAADDILAKEYKNKETSDSRKQEIIAQRDKAGRQGVFLSIDD